MYIHMNQCVGPKDQTFLADFDPPVAKVIDYFQTFFDNQVFQTICDNTNRFRQFCCAQKRIEMPDYSRNENLL